MFLDAPQDFLKVIKNTNFCILSAPSLDLAVLIARAHRAQTVMLSPDEKTGKISVEMVRDFTALTDGRDATDRFFVVEYAEAMNPAAQNAFLKNLEEPQPEHHFVLIADTPSSLLPTILSRAQVFYLRETDALAKPIVADDKVKELAKQLITVSTAKLLALAEDISKKKDNPRAYALAITGTAIEILYKTYFATGQEKFLKKLPHLLKLYDNLSANGHIKLHIVADML